MDESGTIDTEDDIHFLGSPRISLVSPRTHSFKGYSNRLAYLKIIFQKLWNLYIAANTKPLTALLLLLAVIGVNIALFFVAVLTHPVQVDYSLRAFEVTGHPASKRLDSLIAAREDLTRAAKEDRAKHSRRIKRSESNPEVVIHSQYKQKWRLDLVYLAKDDNIFTDEKLKYIHTIEKKLMQHSKFQDFCWKGKDVFKDKALLQNLKGCMPPNSLIDYFFRTDFFDGQGKSLSNVQETLDYLLTKLTTFWYVDEGFGADNRKSKFLRSQINFGIPLKGYEDNDHSLEEQHEIFRKFLVKFVEQLESSSSDEVTVLYGSSEIYDYEIKHTFYHDVMLAVISFGLIILLLFILTSFSLWLTIFGVLTIVFSFPLSYFVYRVLLGINTVGILTGTTAFVIIGIGVDDVFVFINVFRQATHLKDIRERMKHLIATAGKATFFTSFTTAAAFGANALTKVPAVHDFGLFTCILVMSCWLMVVLLMPPALFLWQKWLIKCEMCLCLNKYFHRFSKDNDAANLINNDELELNSAAREMQEIRSRFNSVSNEETLDPNYASSSNDTAVKCCTITDLLTRFMIKFVAKPVIRFRHTVLVLFLVVTSLSVVAITHLKTASGRPELFPADTNLQKLLNLQFNFSSSYVDCTSCAGGVKRVHDSPNIAQPDKLQSRFRRNADSGGVFINGSLWKNDSSGFINDQFYTNNSRLMTTVKAMTFKTTNTLSRVNEELPTPVNLRDVKTTETAGRWGPNHTLTRTTEKVNISGKPTRMVATVREEYATTSAKPKESQVTTSENWSKKQHSDSSIQSKGMTTAKPAIYSKTPTQKLQTVSKHVTKEHPLKRTFSSEARKNITTVGRKEMTTVEHRTTTPVVTTPPLCPKPCTPVKRPIVDKTAIVFLVFGIKGVDQGSVTGKHFFGTNRGTPIYDEKFTMVGDQLQVVATGALVKAFCRICLAFQNNTALVSPGGADCFPRQIYRQLKLFKYEECQELEEPRYANGRPSLSMVGVIHNKIKWMAMAFESTTYKGKSAFSVFEDFHKWENFTRKVLDDPEIPEMLKDGFQTSETWVDMFSEMIAVNGAIYGITLSLIMCLAAVVIFTGNFKLSAIVFITIAGALCLVIATFWAVGWTLGAIEAISLSILVGTSVDYTVHLTEGYIMATKIADFDGLTNREVRSEHSRMALNHIGVSILSSAVTTLIAAIPLCLTKIRLFSKFGEILAINTTMSIVYTLTICVSLLSIMGPTRFRGSMKSHFVAFLAVGLVVGLVALTLYLLNAYAGVSVPGPTGGQLFQ
ncbi:protein dispatched homolog 3-like [Rhopilema esculentum]|uniref:protein dispatched homolog 3-like n=1 Tax=Rhopilema esculentum TaxID=499914 RepID=UPI0031E225D3